MSRLYCVEIGCRPSSNLCRITTSILILSANPDEAARYVREKFPAALEGATIQRVFAAECAIVDWIAGEVEVLDGGGCGGSVV